MRSGMCVKKENVCVCVCVYAAINGDCLADVLVAAVNAVVERRNVFSTPPLTNV
jgi:hypothetical protein